MCTQKLMGSELSLVHVIRNWKIMKEVSYARNKKGIVFFLTHGVL